MPLPHPVDAQTTATPAFLIVVLIVGAGLALVLGLVLAEWTHRARISPLRHLGYLPGPGTDEWTARLDAMRISWRPLVGFRVRLGVYSAVDLALRPGPGEIDGRWSVTSSSPAAARELLQRPAVRAALVALPPVPLALRGDEVTVELRRRYVGRPIHDAVLRLAVALAGAVSTDGRPSGTVRSGVRG